MIIDARIHDLGGFSIRRVLPFSSAGSTRRHVGPFVFLDHIGPAEVERPLFVGEHPHIGLATATCLFAGEIRHRDSIGSDQVIKPGELNLMTAGRWITHSEQGLSREIHGLQFWLALPKAHEQCEPRFEHHPLNPALQWSLSDGATARLIMGSWQGREAKTSFPARTLLATIQLSHEQELNFEFAEDEIGLYVCEGEFGVLKAGQLEIVEGRLKRNAVASAGTRLAIFGGARLDGPRLMKWNYVASTSDLIASAEERWTKESSKF